MSDVNHLVYKDVSGVALAAGGFEMNQESQTMNWLKDPLVTFLIAGAAIFFIAGLFSDEEISYDVEVRDADIKRLYDQWNMQMRRPPTDQELAGLVDQFVKEEIYYRESQRLGLDANDTIVRRRMVQKLTFLTEDIATATPLEESPLREYFEENQEDYRVPQRFSFSHRYFSSDRREDAKRDATRALDTDDNGDPFMLQKEYNGRSEREIGDLFGRGFARALAELEPRDSDQGPIESAFGWHTIRLKMVQTTFVPTFDEVAERVVIDAQQAVRRAANEAYYDDLKARYNVIFTEPTEAIQ